MKPNTETKMSEAQEPVGYIDEFGNFEKSLQNWMIEEPGIDWEPVYKDQTATITAQQEVIKQMRLFMMDNCLNTSGKEVNGNRLSEHAIKALTLQPSLDTLKVYDDEVIERCALELEQHISPSDAMDDLDKIHFEVIARAVEILRAMKALNDRPPHIAKLIGGE